MMVKNYDVVERTFLVKLFYNEQVRNEYLDEILPPIFYNPAVRLAIYGLQILVEKKMPITIDALLTLLESKDKQITRFKRKYRLMDVRMDVIKEILTDVELDSSGNLVDTLYDLLLTSAFSRFVQDAVEDILYWNSFQQPEYEHRIVSKAKAIGTIHNIIHRKRLREKDQLQATMELVNSPDEYITTSSTVLNSYIGGFSRGYVDVIIGKSSHGKSTWTDYNAVHTILTKKVDRIDIITPEESAATRWRRVIAMIAKIPTTAMRQKAVRIEQYHIDKVNKLLGNRLFFHDNVFKYNDIVDLMESLTKSDMIIIDHLQSIEYPGTGTALSRMIGNIPGLVNHQKRIAKHRNVSIINLSQVNDKDIQRSERTIKAPRYWDAYGSSVLYQASREFLAFWYPYKDYEDSPIILSNKMPSIYDIQVSIEKSSFSKVGKFMLKYDPDYATFDDYKKAVDRVINSEGYIPPVEKKLDDNFEDEMELFNENPI